MVVSYYSRVRSCSCINGIRILKSISVLAQHEGNNFTDTTKIYVLLLRFARINISLKGNCRVNRTNAREMNKIKESKLGIDKEREERRKG
jgi:hypothetical protein